MSLTTSNELIKQSMLYGIPLNGIYYKDQLPKYPERGGYIINLQDSDDGNGTHWVCVYIEISGNKKKRYVCCYFDSFGIVPPLQIRDFLKERCDKVLVNTKHIQNLRSGWCGWYCLFFLWFMANHKHFPIENRLEIFTNKFSNDVEKNLTILKKEFAVKNYKD